MDDCYLTIKSEAKAEIKVKGSRFIARAMLTTSLDDALRRLERVRKEEHAATHNCFAYLLGPDEKKREFKYSDDGEPSGTAGRPIYDIVAGRDLTDILLIVTRYFGGTKLGTGGLVRAYSDAAAAALDKAGIKENYVTDKIRVEVDFSFYDQLLKLLTREKVIGHTAEFSESVRLEIEIRRSRTEPVKAAIVELTSGQAKIEDR